MLLITGDMRQWRDGEREDDVECSPRIGAGGRAYASRAPPFHVLTDTHDQLLEISRVFRNIT
jgi:hypothetical protein